MKKIRFIKKAAMVLAAAMLLPMFAVGCQSAQDIIKQRERADEVSKLAEAYMQEKYSRGFKVIKCEAVEGEEYEGDFLISFNGGIHAFYDSEDEMFYDDRQSDTINELIMRDMWKPMFDKLNVVYDNLNDLTQTSYSTIPSVDIELGNQASDHSEEAIDRYAEGLLAGVERAGLVALTALSLTSAKTARNALRCSISSKPISAHILKVSKRAI